MGHQTFPTSGLARVLETSWAVIRLGLLNVLVLFHGIVLAVTTSVAFLVFWTTIFFEVAVPGSHWAFWQGMGISAGSLLVYVLYVGLIRLMSGE